MKKPIKGYLLMSAAVISFAVMSALVKTIPDVNSTTTTFFRFAVGLGILGFLAITKRINLHFVKSPLLILRGITGGFAVYLLYFSITHLGVGKATVFVYCYPIFASLIGTIFLKEKVGVQQWIYTLLAFGGIYLLSIKNDQNISEISKYELMALCGSLLSAISINLVKKLHQTETSTSIFFAQSLIGFWLFIIPTNMTPSIGTPTLAITLIGIGIISAAGQLIMTEAYRHVSVSKGSSMHMMVPLISIIIGYFVFDESFTMREIIGSILIIFACMGVLLGGNLRFRFFGPR